MIDEHFVTARAYDAMKAELEARATRAEAERDGLRGAVEGLPDEIELFRIMEQAGRDRASMAKAVAAHLAALSSTQGEGE